MAVSARSWALPRPGFCCRSSVVEHSLGKGEVDSSILSGSTTKPGQITTLRIVAESRTLPAASGPDVNSVPIHAICSLHVLQTDDGNW